MNSEVLPIAAVVVTYNNADTVLKCIESVLENGVQNIVVVDNASKDETVSRLKNKPVHLVVNEHNSGFATAVNKGVQFLQEKGLISEWLLFLNPDARLLPGSLVAALEYLAAHPRVGVAGLFLCDEVDQPERDAFGDEVTLWSLFSRHMKSSLPATSYPPAGGLQPITCAWVSGGAMLVKTHVFQETSGFDEAFFLYWEDIDFCKRVRAAGYEVVRIPYAKVVHQRGHSLGDTRQKARLYDQSADRYFQKHYSRSIWYLHRILRRFYRWWQPDSL